MIVGFDHLSMSCVDIDATLTDLLDSGYSLSFRENNLENELDKKPLLNTYEARHDMAYIEHENGFVVELTRYSSEKCSIPGNFIINVNNPGCITLQTDKFEEDFRLFSNGLNFKVKQKSETSADLCFSSPFKKWCCDIHLTKTSLNHDKTYLDSDGFPCIAFIATHLRDNLKNLISLGIQSVVSPYNLTVHSKKMLITMFRLPGGALCELIEIKK